MCRTQKALTAHVAQEKAPTPCRHLYTCKGRDSIWFPEHICRERRHVSDLHMYVLVHKEQSMDFIKDLIKSWNLGH